MNRYVVALLTATFTLLGTSKAQDADWSDIVFSRTAQEDLRALYDGLQSAHFNLYVNKTREAYDAKFQQSNRALGEDLSRFELFLELQKFTAFGDVAHARIDFPTSIYNQFRAEGGKIFPIFLRLVDERAYVGENYSGVTAISAGDEILNIDGVPIAHWLEQTSEYISADTPLIAHSLLEFRFPMYLWIELGEKEAFSVRLRNSSGHTNRYIVSAQSEGSMQSTGENSPGIFSLGFNERGARMYSKDIAYLRPGPFYNFEDPERIWDDTAFRAFIDNSFGTFIASDAKQLIIDLRDNPGGDNSFSDHMISRIADEPFRFASKFIIRSSEEAASSNQARLDANPDAAESISAKFADAYAKTPRGQTFEFEIPYANPSDEDSFSGEVYVIINRHSYSNAVNVASIFQDYGWGKIVGEMTADFATTYGAMEHFTLPNSGFTVGFPKGAYHPSVREHDTRRG